MTGLGGTLVVGEALALDEFEPTHWCVTSTLAQESYRATSASSGQPPKNTKAVWALTHP